MSKDLFISYARIDNAGGRIKQLVERIEYEFNTFAGRKLVTFFDVQDIEGMQDWRDRILLGLRESKILLVCLSPAYIMSDYCKWEFEEYQKHEIGHACFGEGVAPIYFVEVPGWDDKGFEQKCAAWVAELRRRHHFDLRPWYNDGEASLGNSIVKERMSKLNEQLKERITLSDREWRSPSNLDSHNIHFIGRTIELRQLREHFVKPGTIGVPAVLNGLGGIGKTTLAIEYAHGFVQEYGGGRWQVRCEGKENLPAAIAQLASPLALELSEEEKRDTFLQFERVLAELRKLTFNNEKNHCLVILDNVDKPVLLKTNQTCHLPAEDWLHLIVTTRLGEKELPDIKDKKCFIPMDVLDETDALALIETYQKNGIFPNKEEREGAREIVRLLDSFTLAVESAAVYLNQTGWQITCKAFLHRLRTEGILWDQKEHFTDQAGIRHGERSLAITLTSTFEILTEGEKLFLKYAACLPPDHIVPQWIRPLLSENFASFCNDPGPGYTDPWINLLRKHLSLRLVQLTKQLDPSGKPRVVKMHRIIGTLIRDYLQINQMTNSKIQYHLGIFLLKRIIEINKQPPDRSGYWELECFYYTLLLRLKERKSYTKVAAVYCCNELRNAGQYSMVSELAGSAIVSGNTGIKEDDDTLAWFHNTAGSADLYMAEFQKAEEHFLLAKELTAQPEADVRDKLDTLVNIGCLYRETNRPLEAVEPSQQALEFCKSIFGDTSPRYGAQCMNLGLVYQDLCNLDKAITLFMQAIEIYKADKRMVLNLCQDMSTLTEALRNASRIKEAWATIEEALSLMKFGGYEEHPISIKLLTNYAALLEEGGDLTQSRTYYEQAYKLTIQCFGEDSNHLSVRINNLGVNSLMAGNYDAAVIELRNALEIENNTHIPSHHKLAHRELNLAIAFLFRNDLAVAKLHLKSGWEHKLITRVPDLLSVRLLLGRLATALITNESIDLFIGQLISLNDEKILPASGINIKWILEPKLEHLIRACSNEQKSIWFYLSYLFRNKTFARNDFHKNDLEQFPKRSLSEPWQS